MIMGVPTCIVGKNLVLSFLEVNRIQVWMVVDGTFLIFAIHNIAVVCEIVTSNKIQNSLQLLFKRNLLRYFVTFLL